MRIVKRKKRVSVKRGKKKEKKEKKRKIILSKNSRFRPDLRPGRNRKRGKKGREGTVITYMVTAGKKKRRRERGGHAVVLLDLGGKTFLPQQVIDRYARGRGEKKGKGKRPSECIGGREGKAPKAGGPLPSRHKESPQ